MKANQIPKLFCIADYQKENFYNASKHQRVQSSLALREKSSKSNSFHSMIPPQKPQLNLNEDQSNRTREGFQRVKTDSNIPMPFRNGRNLSITSGDTEILTNKTFKLPLKNKNPQLVNAYKNEIVTYMKDRTCKSNFKQTAFQFQIEITEKMRNPETLFLTISIVDRILEQFQIPKSKFQLYGVAALFIASKQEEVYSVPHVRDLVYVCDNAYIKEEILEAEGKIISLFSFDLLTTSPYRMLNIYQGTAKLEQKNFMLCRCYFCNQDLKQNYLIQLFQLYFLNSNIFY
ncbi:unnamed protein product [Paramecium sonneborni]|uniref:Cyclin-like domain-containing protein n=1 Tax=Paramecium sonneborni TaxID=65129 RepID=A0A8S1JXS6_9CILI|nr:unnamed protein product [Paramecium sonneborni]